jgi:glyoxylase-like metal-dependent hydrolase (beta-lactamase superfamily II)
MHRITRRALEGCGMLTAIVMAVAVALGAGFASAADGGDTAAGDAAPGSSTGEIHAARLQGNIWLLTGEPGQSNVVASVGEEGTLVVDTGDETVAPKLLAVIQRLQQEHGGEEQAIRLIIDTDSRPDHIGGNAIVAAGGRTIVAGNFARDAQSQGLNDAATVMANVNVLGHLVADNAQRPRGQALLLPEAAIDGAVYNTYFNGEAVQLLHPLKAATDDITEVMFRRSDVIVTGDTVDMRGYPLIDVARGGTIDGELVALNKIIEMAVPADKQEGGTVVVPGHGRLCDQSDVVHYKNVITIIRNRVQYYKNQGKTLQQVLALKPSGDYDERWGATSGPWTTQQFIEAIYKTLPAKGPNFSMQTETLVGGDMSHLPGQVF